MPDEAGAGVADSAAGFGVQAGAEDTPGAEATGASPTAKPRIRAIFLLPLLLVAAFLPIAGVTYAVHAALALLVAFICIPGLLDGVEIERPWAKMLLLIYLYGLVRTGAEAAFEQRPLLVFNWLAWVATSSPLMLFALRFDARGGRFEMVRQTAIAMIIVQGGIGLVQRVLFAPPEHMAAGDVVVGTLFTLNSHLFGMMMLVLGLGVYLSGLGAPRSARRYRRNAALVGGFAIVVFIVTSFLLGLAFSLVFVLCLALVALRWRRRLQVLAALAAAVGFFAYTQADNLRLIYTYATIVDFEESSTLVPRKLIALHETGELFADQPEYLVFGIGAGAYNSRAAMIMTNNYLEGANLGFSSMSKPTEEIISPKWDVRSAEFRSSVLNQPWFTIFAFIAEHGIIISLAFLMFLWRRRRTLADPMLSTFGLFVVCTMTLENWLEYPPYMFCCFIALWLVKNRHVLDETHGDAVAVGDRPSAASGETEGEAQVPAAAPAGTQPE